MNSTHIFIRIKINKQTKNYSFSLNIENATNYLIPIIMNCIRNGIKKN